MQVTDNKTSLEGYENVFRLSDETYRLLRDLLFDACGVYYDDGSKFIVETRLQSALQRRQLDNFKDYYYFLKYDRDKNQEIDCLIDVLTIHETYFFRENRQLQAFSDEILPQILEDPKAQARKHLRIWSAACSTGEEPYTLSMLIQEKEAFKDWKVDILASDISQNVLQSARKGIYQDSSLRSINSYYLLKYFQKEGNKYKILDIVKNPVTFLHLNLSKPELWIFMNEIDIIFCRNVIIYFTTEIKKRVIDAFFKSLTDGGYLLLGHAESLINISTDYSLCHLTNDIVYRKTAASNVSK